MRFLVVDDSKAMQTIVKKALVEAGYADHEFESAMDGASALKTISEWKPDIVLSDWHMPEMSGLELLHEIKKKGLKVKVGLVTTERSKEKVQAAREAGALFIVTKPFNSKTLHDAVEDALGDMDGGGDEKTDTGKKLELILPSARNISRALNAFSRHKVSLEPCDASTLDYQVMPFMTGLYEHEASKKAVGVLVLDAAAACFVGASMQDADVKEASVSIENHLIPKAMFDICQSLINLIATLLHEKASDTEFDVKAVHLINEPGEKLRGTIEKKAHKGKCYDVSVEGYGSGKMLIIAL